MPVSILLLGRKVLLLSEAQAQLENPAIEVYGGTCLEDVQALFVQGTQIDHVFMGAGIELETRLDIAREILSRSNTTNVHLKDAMSGPAGFLPFVRRVMVGLV